MSEVKDFEQAYKAAIEFAKKDKHTLVIATADHTTGGFTIGANGEKIGTQNRFSPLRKHLNSWPKKSVKASRLKMCSPAMAI